MVVVARLLGIVAVVVIVFVVAIIVDIVVSFDVAFLFLAVMCVVFRCLLLATCRCFGMVLCGLMTLIQLAVKWSACSSQNV